MKNKLYLSAPLPFVGQKRMFAREFIKVLKQFPDDVTFVDLFGGSGLLSHIAKRCKPNATVVYNDFDNYRKRLESIDRRYSGNRRQYRSSAQGDHRRHSGAHIRPHSAGGARKRICRFHHALCLDYVFDEVQAERCRNA